MTGKRCVDCKYTKGIGYDFWCGEGHTEYEVFGAETNCPYFEYHDWSKGVPSITEKRFTITQDFEEHHRQIRDNGHIIMGCFVEPQAEVIVELLNELSEENEQCKMMIATLLEENQLIKKHIRELYKYVKIDVDNEMEVYPKALLGGIVDILKIIGDVE